MNCGLPAIMGYLGGSWALLAASRGALAASGAYLKASGGHLGRVLGPCGRTLDRKNRILDKGHRLAPSRTAGGRPRWRRRPESSTGVARFSHSKNEDILRRAEEGHFLRTSHAKSPKRGTTTKGPRLRAHRFVWDWCAFQENVCKRLRRNARATVQGDQE